MRTTITLDSHILNTLKREAQVKTKSRAVLIAIEDFLRRRKLSKIKELKGRITFDQSAEAIRHRQR